MLDVALLGTGGMMPLPNRFLTSFLMRFKGRMMLIDCGEGTQVTMKMLGFGFKNIDTILFTHIHGDHITGLCGLLLTIGNSGRIEPITIVGQKGIEEVVRALLIVAKEIPFELEFVEIDEENLQEMQFGEYTVSALPLDHAITCYAYRIEIKRPGKFSVDKALKNNVPRELWGVLQRKENVTLPDGNTYNYMMVLEDDRKSMVVSYMTDTRPVVGAPEFVCGSDLFICEGIYGENEKIDKAISHKHMIFSEAATIALEGGVEELWLTHFSPALQEPSEFLSNATDIFTNTIVGEDRMTKTIKWK